MTETKAAPVSRHNHLMTGTELSPQAMMISLQPAGPDRPDLR
jgi:hypothetical protein